MSSHEFEQEGDSKKFTATAIFAFAVVFAFIMLLSQCKGTFKPVVPSEQPPAAAEK
ncbi:MAG TPA: hypothetical protein VHB48_12175 [Chitinophagaceae bacterium]|jgi:hypothetical protein|nr:hypothetical protein [Chitinophagaceae bacterium]